MAQQYRNPAGRFVSAADWQRGIGLYTKTVIDPSAIMRDISRQVNGQLSTRLQSYARSMQRSVKTAAGVEQINREMAKAAQQAVITAYGESGIGKRPSYRSRDIGKLRRYSDGAMNRALADPSFATVKGRIIYFGNIPMMDRKAKQWYRLNFGALPIGSKDPDVGKMKFPKSLGGRTSRKSANLNGFKASPRFKVPMSGIGVWSNNFIEGTAYGSVTPVARGSRGQGALYVGRVKIKRRANDSGRSPFFKSSVSARGIQGKRFIDAGARYFNENYPKALAKNFREWNRRAIKSASG